MGEAEGLGSVEEAVSHRECVRARKKREEIMCRVTLVGTILAVLTCGLGATVARAKQATSGIAGVVRDTSGGVLPGITVEAASPAMIGGARAAVTDSNGQDKNIHLRP